MGDQVTDTLSPRLALLGTVSAALLQIRPEAGYIFDLSHGLAETKVAVEQVQMDALPHVIVRIGDERLTDRPVTQGWEIVDTDVVIGFLVKPDPNRWANTPLVKLLEWGIWDVKRAMERHAGASDYGMVAGYSVSVTYGPLDSFAFAMFTYTYGLRLRRGQ